MAGRAKLYILFFCFPIFPHFVSMAFLFFILHFSFSFLLVSWEQSLLKAIVQIEVERYCLSSQSWLFCYSVF